MFYVGPEWFQQQLPNLNPFWSYVFEKWITFCRNQKFNTEKDLLSSSIWYNSQISPDDLFYGTWFKKDIMIVADLLNSDGTSFAQMN